MAKVKRLVPGWSMPHPKEVGPHTIQASIKSAGSLSRDEKSMQAILPFSEEIRKMKVPQQFSALLEIMLATDPKERPSASFVLQSKEFQLFEHLVKDF